MFLYVYEQVETIFSRNGTTIGNWIRISRYIRTFFFKNQIPNPLQSLQGLDFGYFDQGDQRSNQLIAFRNEFAHGAFKADAKYIDQHFVILQDIFDELKDLYQRPIVYIQDGKVHDVETREAIEVSFSLDAYPAEPKNVYVLCSEEQLLLHLSPFFFNINNQLTESKLKKIKVKSLFYAELLLLIFSAIPKKMGGDFDSNASFANRDDFDVDTSTLQDVTHICEKQSEQNIFWWKPIRKSLQIIGTGNIQNHQVGLMPTYFGTLI